MLESDYLNLVELLMYLSHQQAAKTASLDIQRRISRTCDVHFLSRSESSCTISFSFFPNPYQLEEPISNCMAVGWYFSLLFKF